MAPGPSGDLVTTRRSFLSLLPSGVALTGLAGGTVAMLMPPTVRDPTSRRRVCRLAHMDVGGYILLAEAPVLLRRDHQGLQALDLTCTHLGCGVQPQTEGFTCHCHGSTFDREGRPLQGPARRNLPWYEVVVHDGWVFVDLERPVPTGQSTQV